MITKAFSFLVCLTPSLIHSLTHSLTHILTHSYIHSLIYSLTHILTHSYTHSLIYSLTHWILCNCMFISDLVLFLLSCSENTYLFGTYHQSISGYFNPAGDQKILCSILFLYKSQLCLQLLFRYIWNHGSDWLIRLNPCDLFLAYLPITELSFNTTCGGLDFMMDV